MPPKRHSWDRLDNETVKAFNAFRTYVALGANRSFSSAIKVSTGKVPTDALMSQYKGWSVKYSWVARALARDEWLATSADELVKANLHQAYLAITTRALELIHSDDPEKIALGSKMIKDHYPPVSQLEISDKIEDLSDLSDAALLQMKAIRDKARSNAKTVH